MRAEVSQVDGRLRYFVRPVDAVEQRLLTDLIDLTTERNLLIRVIGGERGNQKVHGVPHPAALSMGFELVSPDGATFTINPDDLAQYDPQRPHDKKVTDRGGS